MIRIKTAMILAAGFGSRLKHLTAKNPKALVEFRGKPMIENVIAKLESFGINNIYINTHHHHNVMIDYFKKRQKSLSNITLIHENEILGTGGGIKNAEKYLSDASDFLVYNTDIDSDIDLNEFENYHFQSDSIATLAVKNRKTSRYLLTDKDGILIGRTENGDNIIYKTDIKNNIETKAFCGIHIISNRIFDFIPAAVKSDIIPVYMSMLKQGFKVSTFDIRDTCWKDLGIPDNL